MREPGHVSLWHPWVDRPGQHHSLGVWNGQYDFTDMDDSVFRFATDKCYAFCNDLFDLPFIDPLLRHAKSRAFISKTGSIVALKVSQGRKHSYFIPAEIWKYDREPDKELIKNVGHVFHLFGYEALSPASLSEKLLRSTLPNRTFISRPSDMLRRVLVENSIGGRIDQARIAQFYPVIYEYDLNKAYLYFARSVPSPFKAPVHFWYGEKGTQDDRWTRFAASFVHVCLSVCGGDVSPIQVVDKDTQETRSPEAGEVIQRWLWDVELRDCLDAGYRLEHIYEGYGWHELSNFMVEWSDILCEKDALIENEHQKAIAKTMKVGLPGRFLKRPEIYSLVHKSERKKGEKLQPILVRWTKETKQFVADWYIRTEYDLDSAQLTPIGSYIVAQCRQALYHRQLEEIRSGNEIISSYIDCVRVRKPTTLAGVGAIPGLWKEKTIEEAWAIDNRIIPKEFAAMIAPGLEKDSAERKELYASYFNA